MSILSFQVTSILRPEPFHPLHHAVPVVASSALQDGVAPTQFRQSTPEVLEGLKNFKVDY